MNAATRRARKQQSTDAATQQLRRRFSEAGVTVDDAVPVFTGLYPRFAGYGNVELVFTRSRILALIENNVQIWRAATGPMPTTLIATYPLADLTFPLSERRRYDLVRVSDRQLWIHRRYRERTHAWITTLR